MSAYESIKKGLTEAIEFSRDDTNGKPVDARACRVEVREVDVAAIRARTRANRLR